MDIGEFIDSYSDDLISLREGRIALLTHPLHPNDAAADLIDASFCRMLAIIVVGSIEAMLSAWIERDRVNVLRKYFAKNVQNGDRIQSLYEAFHSAGLSVDREVFDDYLAVKYIRNTIIHGQWKAHEKEWVTGRGFPTDSRKLTAAHWTQIQHVNESMMLYIALTAYAQPDKSAKPSSIIKLGRHDREQDPHLGVLFPSDVDRILWNNLDRISAIFGTAIQEAATSAEYNWTGSQSAEQIRALAPSDAKRRFYTVARRAGLANFEPLTRHRNLVSTALECWRDYYRRVTSRFGLDEASVTESLAVFADTRFDPSAPHWPVIQNLSESEGERLMRHVWPIADADFVESMSSALRIGRLAYDLFANLMPVQLLGVQLPIIDPSGTAQYSKEFDRAYEAVRLGRAWYACIERHKAFHSENLDLYRQLRADFALS